MKLAIIPARGGSKRIPRKNIKLFHGKPMISYAIDAAFASKMFDHVIVSTDDAEIAEVAKNHGAELPFVRPPELADDYTPTAPVISHGIQVCINMGWEVDDVCCIYPSVPFISSFDLRMAHEKLLASESHFVFPVTTFPSPIQRALRRLDNGRVQPFQPEHSSTRTQDLEPAYFDIGQFYWGKTASWLAGLHAHLTGTTLVVPEWRAVDIDTQEDWERAELLYDAIKGQVQIPKS